MTGDTLEISERPAELSPELARVAQMAYYNDGQFSLRGAFGLPALPEPLNWDLAIAVAYDAFMGPQDMVGLLHIPMQEAEALLARAAVGSLGTKAGAPPWAQYVLHIVNVARAMKISLVSAFLMEEGHYLNGNLPPELVELYEAREELIAGRMAKAMMEGP